MKADVTATTTYRGATIQEMTTRNGVSYRWEIELDGRRICGSGSTIRGAKMAIARAIRMVGNH